jgi:hypothetical protein
VLASGNGREKGIEGNHAIDLRRGETKAFCDAVLDFLGKVSADVLCLFQYRDEGSIPSLIFGNHLINLFPFLFGDGFSQSHLFSSSKLTGRNQKAAKMVLWGSRPVPACR